MGEMTALEVAEAWHSVTDEWFVRLYKGKPRPWQVCCLSGDVISDETLKVVGSYSSDFVANRRRDGLENQARGAAVIRAMRRKSKKSVKAGERTND